MLALGSRDLARAQSLFDDPGTILRRYVHPPSGRREAVSVDNIVAEAIFAVNEGVKNARAVVLNPHITASARLPRCCSEVRPRCLHHLELECWNLHMSLRGTCRTLGYTFELIRILLVPSKLESPPPTPLHGSPGFRLPEDGDARRNVTALSSFVNSDLIPALCLQIGRSPFRNALTANTAMALNEGIFGDDRHMKHAIRVWRKDVVPKSPAPRRSRYSEMQTRALSVLPAMSIRFSVSRKVGKERNVFRTEAVGHVTESDARSLIYCPTGCCIVAYTMCITKAADLDGHPILRRELAELSSKHHKSVDSLLDEGRHIVKNAAFRASRVKAKEAKAKKAIEKKLASAPPCARMPPRARKAVRRVPARPLPLNSPRSPAVRTGLSRLRMKTGARRALPL